MAIPAPTSQQPSIMPAKPQQNPDWAALSALAIKRFPKILNKLAE